MSLSRANSEEPRGIALTVQLGGPSPATADRSHASAVWNAVHGVPRRVLLGLITVYQRFLSPVLPVVTLGGCACRFTPSCSHYAAEAVRVHGAVRGAWLALQRLLKCTPLHPGGDDPVPPRVRPFCHKSPSPLAS